MFLLVMLILVMIPLVMFLSTMLPLVMLLLTMLLLVLLPLNRTCTWTNLVMYPKNPSHFWISEAACSCFWFPEAACYWLEAACFWLPKNFMGLSSFGYWKVLQSSRAKC